MSYSSGPGGAGGEAAVGDVLRAKEELTRERDGRGRPRHSPKAKCGERVLWDPTPHGRQGILIVPPESRCEGAWWSGFTVSSHQPGNTLQIIPCSPLFLPKKLITEVKYIGNADCVFSVEEIGFFWEVFLGAVSNDRFFTRAR